MTTERRIELLRALIATDGAAENISTLADALNRDYRRVPDDVILLDRYGLIRRTMSFGDMVGGAETNR